MATEHNGQSLTDGPFTHLKAKQSLIVSRTILSRLQSKHLGQTRLEPTIPMVIQIMRRISTYSRKPYVLLFSPKTDS